MSDDIREQAKQWIKDNKKTLIKHFASDEICPSEKNTEPFTIFMAGSPGAGKTESSIAILESGLNAVHIDADAIRNIIPYYKGDNSHEIQGAAALGVEKLYDHVLATRKNAIVDATFTPYEKAEDNVKRSLDKGRDVYIFYVHQPPIIAWNYTKIRERLEGRPVPRQVFIRAYLESPENVRKIHHKYGKSITVFLIKKNYENRSIEFFEDTRDFDKIFDIVYNIDDLEEVIL
jgi:UDP-N-acetylglucosamine kinase